MMNELGHTDPEQPQVGRIRHETLSPQLLVQIKAVYDVIGPYLDTNLEQFELKFMRDLHPEKEAAIWIVITTVWFSYHEKYLNNETLADEDERSLLDALLLLTTGADQASTMNVPEDVGRKLRQCYDSLGQADEA